MAVGVSHQFVTLLTGGVKTERVVDVLVHRKWHGCIGAINAGAAGVDEVLNAIVPAALKDVCETDDVAVDVGEWVFDGVTHAGLGSEIDHTLGLVGSEASFHRLAIGKIDTQVSVIGMIGISRHPCLLNSRVVVVVVVINANDNIATSQQS